jgi:uncharacterized damage-inducible protein DinB
MLSLSEICAAQYQLVLGSRNRLFEYCQTVAPEHYISEAHAFGGGASMRSLMAHVATVYEYWIGTIALQLPVPDTDPAPYRTIAEVMEKFKKADQLMEQFLQVLPQLPPEISFNLGGQVQHASPFTIFTHAITHEFHHKGQVLSISRHLGYTPWDTDVIHA